MSVTQNLLSRQLELRCTRRQPLPVFVSSECSPSLDREEGEGRGGGNVPGETRRRRRQKISKGYPNSYVKRLNENLHGIPNMVEDLRAAVNSGNLKTITKVVTWVSREVMDAQVLSFQGSPLAYIDPDNSATSVKRLAREDFVLLGGPELLVKLFCNPLSPKDARYLSSHEISDRVRMWDVALLALRELSYMDPALASRLASKDFIHFLLSLMSIPYVFDNAVALVEEVLATQSTTFLLDSVPRITELLQSLDSRQLAHFCRVLSLLVFDSEDRQLMESNTVLHSMDLLQMRRNRVYSAGSVVDRNHAVILVVPGLLSRIAKLVQLINFGPSLNHPPDSQDLLHTILEHGERDEGGDWESIDKLLKCANEGPETEEESGIEGNGPSSSQIPSGGGPRGLLRWFRNAGAASQPAPSTSRPSSSEQPEEPAREEGGGSFIITSSDELGDGGISVVQHGVDSTGGLLFAAVSSRDGSGMGVAPDIDVDVAARVINFACSFQSSSEPRARSLRSINRISRTEARLRLQFRALMLFPHYVEIIFVLSTLLGGRRKSDVQQLLADMGIVESLTDMFPRLSWGCPPSSPNPLECIHGPDCECNPESALRVQYLRLVHNFFDGDCTPAPNHKYLMLSKEEREAEAVYANDIDTKHAKNGGGNNNAPPFQTRHKGLLSMIIDVYMSEPTQSIYRFWLASCMEAFLRGASAKEQSFVARSGLLKHLTTEITSHPCSKQKELGRENAADIRNFEKTCHGGSSHSGGTGSLQAAFDVLAELSKGNLDLLQQLDDSLDANGLVHLFQVIRLNLVDSNVFLRSLVITLELFNESWNEELDDEDTGNEELGLAEEKESKSSFQRCSSTEVGYLSCAWWNVQTECGGLDVPSPPHSKPESGAFVSGHGLGGLGCNLENRVPQMQMEECEEVTAPSKPDATMTNFGARGGGGGLITTTPKQTLPPRKQRKGKRCERLCRFLKEDSQQLLVDLMDIVSLHKLNYENLCTINSVILMIIQMRRSGGVGAITSTIENIRASPRGDYTLKGFCALLFFWREYYGKRGRDRINLEFSSHVPFCEWLEVVEMLCADNGRPGSLVPEAIKLPQSPYARRPFI